MLHDAARPTPPAAARSTGLVTSRACAAIVAMMLATCVPARETRACSQCMCGTPFPADALGGVVPMQLRYGLEDRYLSKSNALDDGPGSEEEREHRLSAFALWRAHNRLAILGRVPWNVKTIVESPEGEAEETRTARGFGDAELMALVGLVHTDGARAAVLGMVAGVTVPTGSNDLTGADGERLDAHLQPGAGAWSGTAGLNLSGNAGRGLVDGSVLGRVNGTNAHGYRYGNTLLYNFGYSSPFRGGVRWLMHLNGRSAERDRTEDGSDDENSGGTVVYLAPGLHWQTGLGVDLEGLVQVPVIESLYGIQDEHVTGRVALSLSR